MQFLASKQRHHFFKSQKALTLAECLVSIVILAITLVAGMAFYFNSGAIMGRAMHKKMAMEMANQKMETIKQAGFDALGVTVGFVDEPVVTFGDFSLKNMRKRVTSVDGTSNGVKQVEIEVIWTESGTDQVIALSTYVAKP